MGLRSSLNNINQILYWRNYAKKLEEHWFLCTRSIGDTVIFLSKLKAYRDKNPGEKIRLIVSENHVPFVKGYSDYIDEYKVLPYEKMCASTSIGFKGLLPDNLKYILPSSSSIILGYKSMSIFDLMNMTLGLDPDTGYEKPHFQWKNKKEFLASKGVEKGKFVFLAPSSVSVNSNNADMWKKIISCVKKKGYKVLINKGSYDNNLFENEEVVSLPLDKAYLLAEDSALFIGMRSGICDLLGFSSSKMLVLYPDGREADMKSFTFSNMPFDKSIEECYESQAVSRVNEMLDHI